VIDRGYLSVFNEKQLEFVLSGTVEIDLDDWREHTEYKGGYSDTHVVIIWFWDLLYELTNAERLQLLQVEFDRDFKQRMLIVCDGNNLSAYGWLQKSTRF
jgi:hypothetical protein